MQKDKLKRNVNTALLIIGKSVFWMILQYSVIVILASLRINVSQFLYFGGLNGIFAGLSYDVATIEVGIIYTIVGVIVTHLVGLNTPKWWKLFWILYIIYAALTLLGMYGFMGAWFFEGYGCLIIEVWIAPLLWLGELELWNYIRSRRRLRRQV